VLQTDRGFRVGIRGERESVIELATSAPGIDRLAIRAATLEDAYFAHTREGGK